MCAMTSPEELKSLIIDTWRDEEMASSACCGIDAYSKLWPFVLVVNEWDVWNETKRNLSREVIDWLESHGGTWDFYHLLGTWGLVGFKDLKAATHFNLRWSGALKASSAPGQTWNPHPLNSSFSPSQSRKVSSRTSHSGQSAR
jgi:hypothetical protein